MKPNLHPEQAKALYREIANDAAPRKPKVPGIGLGPADDGAPISDNMLELAIAGALALVGGVAFMAFLRSLV